MNLTYLKYRQFPMTPMTLKNQMYRQFPNFLMTH
jgi:hypothetical protein